MALAQVREVDRDAKSVVLEVDTGTNPHFRVQLGTRVRLVDGIHVLDGPYWSSSWQRNPRAGRHLDTTLPFRLDRAVVQERQSLIQVQSSKDDQGRGRAFSTPVQIGAKDFDDAHWPNSSPDEEDVMRLAQTTSLGAGRLARRNVAHTTAKGAFSRQASMDDFLGTLVRIAGPIIKDLLSQPEGATSSLLSPEVLGVLLRSALEAVAKTDAAEVATTGGFASTGASGSPALPITDGVVAASSTRTPEFLEASTGRGPAGGDLFSTPKSVQIDWRPASAISGGDLLVRMTDSLMDLLPQLLNAVAVRHIRRRDDDRVLVHDAMTTAVRMRLLQMLSPAAIAAPGSLADNDLAQLMRILAASPVPAPVGTPAVPAPPAASAPPATAQAKSVPNATGGFASKAVLTPLLAPPMQRQNGTFVVFTPEQGVTLRFQLDVGSAGPALPLPRAILDVVVREPGAAAPLLTRTERLTQVQPGTPLGIRLTSAELAFLPREVGLEITATLRWPGRAGVYHTGCSCTIVLAGVRSVAARGASVGESRELTDIARFRSFWNRVWATEHEGDDQPLWGFDAALRYSVVLAGSDRGNGIMSTRADLRPVDGGVRVVMGGRIKGGIEIAVRELNMLLPLWDGEQPLAAEVLEAFGGPAWLASNSGDATFNVRFEGRRRTRGVLWAVPVLGLRTFTVTSPGDIDPFGQVISMTSEDVRFPVVEAVRLLGLRSTSDEETPEPTTSGYRFDGYEVAYETKAELQPASEEAS